MLRNKLIPFKSDAKITIHGMLKYKWKYLFCMLSIFYITFVYVGQNKHIKEITFLSDFKEYKLHKYISKSLYFFPSVGIRNT